MLGAGGSILLLPLLVSGASLPTREAVPLSLLVVTVLALANLMPYLKRRQFAPRAAVILGVFTSISDFSLTQVVILFTDWVS